MLTKGIFLTISDLVIITGRSYSQSFREYHLIKDTLGKKKHQKITKKEYANYHGIAFEEINQGLKLA